MDGDPENIRSSFALFRRPDKYHIGEDFDLFVKKLCLYFEAVEVTDTKKRRLALLFNLSENAFRLAESIEFPDNEDAWKEWVSQLKSLFDRNQTLTEKRYNFNRRVQETGESVDSYAVALKEFAAKCEFQGEEYKHRLVDQFILGISDRSTQNKLLQEPPATLEEGLLIARRFEAANATMKTLKTESALAKQSVVRSFAPVQGISASPLMNNKVCFTCQGFGHIARDCPSPSLNSSRPESQNERTCFNCNRKGHIARNCRVKQTPNNVMVNRTQPRATNRRIQTPPECFRCGQIGHVSRFCRADFKAIDSREERRTPVEQKQAKIRLSTVSATNKRKSLLVEVQINGHNKLCIIDTGASISLISKDQWETLNVNKISLVPSDIVAEAANNSTIGILGRVELPVAVNGSENMQEFYVASDIKTDIILGLDWIINCRAKIDAASMLLHLPNAISQRIAVFDSAITDPTAVVLHEDIEIPGRHEICQTARIKNPINADSLLEPNPKLVEKGVLVARVIVTPINQSVPVQIINPGAQPVKLYKGMKVGDLQVMDIDCKDPILDEGGCDSSLFTDLDFNIEHLKLKEKEKLGRVLNTFSNVFAKTSNDLGKTSLTEHRIETGNAAPIKQLPRRLPNALRQVVEEQVQDMLENEVIKHSNSPWASPIVLVRKKDGTWRFCVDFRKLNDATIKDAYPLPQVSDLIDTLSGHHYFTTLDLASGYWQVPVEKSSQEKTTFVVPGGGHYEFLRLPFGLTNAVPTFQRLMATVLEGLRPSKCLVYIDDILIIGKTFEQHLNHLIEVLQAIRNAGLKLKPTKCSFAQHEVKFLGFVISSKGLAPDPDKVKAIRAYPQPKNLTELRRFMGMASYYRRFVSGFSDIAQPINKLLQKDSNFQWNTQCDRAFVTLKEALTSEPVLGFPDPTRNFIVYTDASDIGIGAVLCQTNEDNSEFVISYASKAFSKAEKNWTTTDKESYAVVWALEYFHAYVYGRKVTIFTDHKALEWLRQQKSPNGKLARWILKLEEYDYTIVHRPGKLMGHVDALSRAPVQSIAVQDISYSEIAQEQEEEPSIRTVIHWIQNDNKPDKVPDNSSSLLKTLYNLFDSLKLKHRVLFRVWRTEDTEIDQIVLPEQLREDALTKAHLAAGHMGTAKTFALLQKYYYWPGFYKSVEEYCQSCITCARNKQVPRPRLPLQSIKIVPIPFYMIGMDIIGPLKRTKFGNVYILSIIDYFTKYAEAIALPNQKAETIARVLEDIFSRHGAPSVIITDQGTNFQSLIVSSICKLFNIEHRRTSAYHPQTDGLCERFNKTLKSLLRMTVNSDKDNWDELLPSALLAYRICKQDTTGYSPFELLYGRDPRIGLDIQEGGEDEVRLRKPISGPAQYIAELKERHLNFREKVANRIERVQEKQRRNYDKTFKTEKSMSFNEGDIVLYKNFRASGLDEKYHGPFKVINVMKPNCEIESLATGLKKVVHSNNLKPFRLANLQEEELVELDESEESELEDFDTEACNVARRMSVQDRNANRAHRNYNLRQTIRQPERYGNPIYDY